MNIINHASDQIRQIVPADMSFLSDADQQTTQALHHILAAMFGGDGTETIVLSGCEITTNAPQPSGTISADTVWVGDINVQTYQYWITAGLLLHGGRIYELAAAEWTEGNPNYIWYSGGMGTPMPVGLIVFGDEPASPSPVYGESLELDQYPHRRLTAAIRQATVTTRHQRSANNPLDLTITSTYNTDAADYVEATKIKRIPVLGSFTR